MYQFRKLMWKIVNFMKGKNRLKLFKNEISSRTYQLNDVKQKLGLRKRIQKKFWNEIYCRIGVNSHLKSLILIKD